MNNTEETQKILKFGDIKPAHGSIKADDDFREHMTPPGKTTLTNGIRIVNFSSGHDFTFVDARILPACENDRVTLLKLEPKEHQVLDNGVWKDIAIDFALTQIVLDELADLQADESIDIILVPRIVMDAIKQRDFPVGKCRTGRAVSRHTRKPSLWHIDKFCT